MSSIYASAVLASLSLTDISNIATTAGSIGAGIGFVFIAIQLRDARRFTRAELVNSLEQEFRTHYTVYNRLMPEGDWSNDAAGPQTHEEYGAIEAYLEFFEKMQLLLELGVMQLPNLDRMFAHRFFLIMHNRHVQAAILYRDQAYFSALIRLYREWYDYRQRCHRPIPHSEYAVRDAFTLAS